MWILFIIVILFTLIYLKAIEMRKEKSNRNSNKFEKYLETSHYYVIAFIFLIIVTTVLLFFTLPKPASPKTPSFPNEFGDAFGGILNPLVALLAAGLTFLAFYVQFQANQNQRKDISRERFESRFYEMLRLHRDNVSEIEIAEISGRRAFMRMFFELKYIFYLVNKIYLNRKNTLSDVFNEEEILSMSFKIFYHGINDIPGINIVSIYQGKEKELYYLAHNNLEKIQKRYKLGATNIEYISHQVSDDLDATYTLEFKYKPFCGHESKLGHYYRHLYQMVKFVEDNTKEFEHTERRSYMKLIRAQLSDHEQLLLYYNSFSYGHKWFSEDLLSDWRLIKNIPIHHANFGILPKTKLGRTNRFNEPIFEGLK